MTDRELLELALKTLELVTDLTSYDDELYEAIDAIRTRLAQPEQTSIAEQYAHRLAILLECMVLSPDKTWNEANNLVSEYQDALHKERMNAGEPYVSGFGKD